MVLHLRQIWHDLPAQPGDTLNLLAPVDAHADGSLHAVCDSCQGLAILHPDVLISGGSHFSIVAAPCPGLQGGMTACLPKGIPAGQSSIGGQCQAFPG